MKSYRELAIYKESKQLAIEIHKMSLLLPKLELYEEGSQIRRSSKAIQVQLLKDMEEEDINRTSSSFLFTLSLNVMKQSYISAFCSKPNL